ncbi:SDR family oxidoreductase [Paludifilum halophilum]|uniref:NAD(P)-dependent oxidoreductase n=1 Tax=Paludifilum halophilum TaxID=1642702 RepID=A0A235B1T8_9BACL|nr:SDR family oxidoreductase [Paludifilum halophilum]OYD06276.1 NAD(P)-dependent oxidoreductase [Paludifilum halophilum]
MYPMVPYYGRKKVYREIPLTFPPQQQNRQPGLESLMVPRPISDNPSYSGSGKLRGQVAIITGGDSGIGRAVAIAFAKEGADLVIVYLNEHADAKDTQSRVEYYGARCLLISGDLREESFSREVVDQTLRKFGRIHILVNNHAIQFYQKSILDISAEQLDHTFRTNVYAFFYLTKAVLPYLSPGSSIIQTTSAVAYEGHEALLDYSATKGAILSFTRALSQSLLNRGIRVNGVAPGPIWTPLIPSSFPPEDVSTFGVDSPMKHAGQPFELAPAYVYLACDDSKYVSGQVLHVNGGEMVSS